VTGELVPFEHDPSGQGASPVAVERLAQALMRYARDGAMRAAQGRAARAQAMARFDARAHGARIQREIVLAARPGLHGAV
jgi:hypothetical protein